MPTPSEISSREWAARPGFAPRSVFENFQQPHAASGGVHEAVELPGDNAVPASSLDLVHSEGSLQSAIDTALARAFLYRFLASAFEEPTPSAWAVLGGHQLRSGYEAAIRILAAGDAPLRQVADALQTELQPARFEPFFAACLAAFGHAARGRCPCNELEYGDIKADPLFQPHRLADLAAFYRAFGLSLSDDAGERLDHIAVELEFMSVLAAKEAYAFEYQLEGEDLATGRAAQRQFLRDHLARWTPAFTVRLAAMSRGTPLAALAALTRTFILSDCCRLGVAPGSEDLLLRPVDQAAESLCESCGLAGQPPGGPGPSTSEGV